VCGAAAPDVGGEVVATLVGAFFAVVVGGEVVVEGGAVVEVVVPLDHAGASNRWRAWSVGAPQAARTTERVATTMHSRLTVLFSE
jgi:hypothetical protein